MKDKSDLDRLLNMSESAIEKAAKSDPDSPLLTEKELKEFKPVHPVEKIDIKEIRKKLNFSQAKFAFYFGVSKRTLQEWEQNKRTPSGATRNFLKVIEKEPSAVIRALSDI